MFERIGFPVIVLAVVSCTNGAAVSDGFGIDSVNPSDDGGGGSGDGASATGPSNPTANAQGGQGGQDAAPSQTGPSQTGSNDGGASQSSNRDSSAGRADSGGGQSDATVGAVDASTVDASAPDVSSAVTYDAAVCTTQNLGCMLAPPPSTGDIRQDCVNRINQFRTQCACLPPLQRWTAGEQCADQEATYDSQNNTAHGGFIQTETACSQGSTMWAACCGMTAFGGSGPLANAQDECPGYPDTASVIGTCLQQMWNEGPPPNGESVQACEMDNAGCFQMHGHFINMTSTTSTKVACGFSSMTGPGLWAAQNFAP